MGEKDEPVSNAVQKIAKECSEAGANEWTITRIVKELNNAETTNPNRLRKLALQKLQELDSAAAKVYASFQKMQVRTSKLEIEPFDRGNIIKSLLKETDVTRGVAERIGNEVENQVKDLEIEHISTSLIREMVNVKLLEYGHESIRNQYTRLGLPVFEIESLIGKIPYNNRAMMNEFSLLKVIPKNLGEMHLRSDVFIAELHEFSTKPLSISIEPVKDETAKQTAFQTVAKANLLHGFVSWQPNIDALNLFLAVGQERNKSAGEIAGLFHSAVAAAFPRKRKINGLISMNLFVPDNLEWLKADEEHSAQIANAFLEHCREKSMHSFSPAVSVDSKYRLKLLEEPMKETLIINCKNRQLRPLNGIFSENPGISCLAGLNLVKIALSSRRNETEFLYGVQDIAREIKQLHEIKATALKKRDYIKRHKINVEQMQSVLALHQLFEAGRQVLQSNEEKQVLQFSNKTVSAIERALGKDWVIASLNNPEAINRFQKANKKNFGFSNAIQDSAEELMQLQKEVCFTAVAKNKNRLNELIDSGKGLILFKPS